MQYHRTGGNEVAQVLESFVYYFIVVESQGRQLVVHEPFGPRGIVAGQQVVVRLAYQCQESHGYHSTARVAVNVAEYTELAQVGTTDRCFLSQFASGTFLDGFVHEHKASG